MEQSKEISTVSLMIDIYCHKKHKSKKGVLCSDCSALIKYVIARRCNCPFGDAKPFCSHCKIHCYKKDMREKIRKVMRYCGPRMFFHHPIIAIRHIKNTLSEKLRTKKDKQKADANSKKST